jgi:putative tryptophan/tyrosine transport system substrate-binding protein
MRSRRKFIRLLGGAAAWPLAARAQQAAMPVVGWLGSNSASESMNDVTAFWGGLNESDYFEGQNVTIDYRWAAGQLDRLSGFANDLVRRQVAVIVAAGGASVALAAQAATAKIPIVFNSGTDPVKLGLVSSFNRPGRNLTGVSQLTNDLTAKRLELLLMLVPTAVALCALINPSNPNAEANIREVEATARTVRREVHIFKASTSREIDTAFTSLVRLRAGALLVVGDPFFTARRDQFVSLTARHAIPAIYDVREYVVSGGLISYGANLADVYRLLGTYVGRILKGARPADLPVMQPTKFDLVINLKSAKALGLEIPDKLSALADEVIE